MRPLRDDIKAWMPGLHRGAGAVWARPVLDHIGRVERIGDDIALVRGLPETRLDELLTFADGSLGVAVKLEGHRIGCILLNRSDAISAGTEVRGTGSVVQVPVGEGLLGRVVDVLGTPLDGGPPVSATRFEPVERPAPAIVDRDPVVKPLMTGLTVVDAMIPIGRGQRELIIGDRKTGKTAAAIDAIVNQRDSEVVCVYVAVGQKSSTVKQAVAALREHGAFERCIVVIGAADAPAGAQWLAPYAACTMAEYFRDSGRDALLVIDDLTKHAIVYRQLALLLRNPPGREAYPGDVFYMHARLLERAGKLSEALGGGSLTALPIAETQSGNLSAYIPTNLVSITDGQIYFEPQLFYEGHKPAVNVGLSVSRVGGKTQAPAMRHLAEHLRLDYAQFLELEVFTRFGGMVDERSRRSIEHGRRIRAILTQPEYAPLSLAHQVALLLAAGRGLLDALPLERIPDFRQGLAAGLAARCPQILNRIETSGALGEADELDLLEALEALAAATGTACGTAGA